MIRLLDSHSSTEFSYDENNTISGNYASDLCYIVKPNVVASGAPSLEIPARAVSDWDRLERQPLNTTMTIRLEHVAPTQQSMA